MSSNVNYLAPVSEASVEVRSNFIWKCYAHVVGGLIAFVAIEAYLFSSGTAEGLAIRMSNSPMMVFGAFLLVSWGATRLAHTLKSIASQYIAFAALVFIWAIMFLPMLHIALTEPRYAGVVDSAAGVTLLGCVGLIATAMITRKDFTFLRGMLIWGGMLALVAIISSLIFGFHLGTWFSVAMIGFAGSAVLYDTSNIIHHYPQDKYVAASMQLFASIVMMFWYILRLFMHRN